MTEACLREDRGAVAVLTLNRPDRLNAWSPDLERDYFGHLEAAEADPGIRAIVVTGAGRGFCAGADMDLLASAGGAPEGGRGGLGEPQGPRPRHYPLSLRTPLVAAINGPAAGLGLVQALYCDIRFATPEAKLATSFAQRGLIGEYGITWLLPRLVGAGHAADLMLSGRVVLGAEAHRMGLVNRLSPPERVLKDAVEYAEQLARHASPRSMAIIKDQLLADTDRTLADSLAVAQREMRAAFAAPDLPEGVASYLERRPPNFPSLSPPKE